jgi:HK97 family phage major capsid protein
MSAQGRRDMEGRSRFELVEFRKLGPAARLAQLRGQQLERLFQVERGGIDEKARTAWISIASDAPYERWWGIEVLNMSPSSIRDDRLRAGAPLLVEHDTADQIGVIENFELTADKKLRILGRFGKSARAEEIWRDVVDGIRRSASVGYMVHDLVLEKQEEDVSTYRVTDWEPLEGSLVAVPADPTVGVGRNHSMKGNRVMEQDSVSKADLAEALRVRDLLAAGEAYKHQGGPELARELIARPGATAETFKVTLLERMRGTHRPMSPQLDRPYAFGEGARVYFQGVSKLKAFTNLPGGMTAVEAAYRSGVWLAGALGRKRWAIDKARDLGIDVSYRDASGELVHGDPEGGLIRAQNENVLSAGGALVPIEMEAAVINLRDTYGAARRIARIRPMNTDQLKIPRRKTGVSAFFFQDDDGVGITESAKNWDNVTFSTKKLGVLTKVSRDLTEDSIIPVVDDLANEMAYAFGQKEDQCMLIGDGSSTYGGIQGVNPKFESTAYISRSAFAAGHNTWGTVDNTDITSTMGQLAQYADSPQAVFVCSHLAKHALFNRLKAIAGGNRVDVLGMSPDNTYLGYQIVTSEAMPKITTSLANKVMFLFGRFDLALSMGSRRGIEVQTLVERYAELGQIGVIATERFDIVVHDLGTTSISDVNGGRGPIACGFGTT